jgi:multiple sugar transport system permease protein
MSNALRRLFVLVSLLLLATAILLPLFWMVSVSLMETGASQREPPPLLPPKPTWQQYQLLFSRSGLARALANSLVVAVAATLGSLLVNGLAGYAFARLRFPGREKLFSVLLLLLLVPSQVAMLPLFLVLRGLHLTNSLAGVVVPALASAYGIFLVRQYALSIPQELVDAARVDGAGEFRLFFSVVLPLLRPILVTLAAFTFVGAWNDFLWPLVVLSDEKLYTLPVALATLAGEHSQDVELMMAGAVVAIGPVLLLFAVLQRHYIAGLALGGLKE